jgi:hypothetical protein
MLAVLPKYPCLPDKETIINELITAIWEHPCPAYARLRRKIATRAKELSRGYIFVPVDRTPMDKDTTERTYRWYP